MQKNTVFIGQHFIPVPLNQTQLVLLALYCSEQKPSELALPFNYFLFSYAYSLAMIIHIFITCK